MREDFDKVIHERGRGGDRSHKKTHLKIDPRRVEEDLDLPNRAPVSRNKQYGWNSRSTSFRTQAFDRFLEKHLGQSWNQVYSEIRQVFKKHTHSNDKLSHFLPRHVELNCYVGKDKVIYQNQAYMRAGWEEIPVHGFYVHPKTGLLGYTKGKRKVSEKERRQKMVNRIDQITVDDRCGYTLRDDTRWKDWVDGHRPEPKYRWYKTGYTILTCDKEIWEGWRTVLRKAGDRVVAGYRRCNEKEMLRVEELLEQEREHILKTGQRLRSEG